MFELPKIGQEKEPNGKRWYRWNIYGNFVGYVGRRRWMVFAREADAIEWVNEKKVSPVSESGLDPNGVPYWMSAMRPVPSQHDAHYQVFLQRVRGLYPVVIDLAEEKRMERGGRSDAQVDYDLDCLGYAR